MGIKRENKYYNDAVVMLSKAENASIDNLYFLCSKNINYDENLVKLNNIMNLSDSDEDRTEAAKRIIMLGTKDEKRSDMVFKGVRDYVVD